MNNFHTDSSIAQQPIDNWAPIQNPDAKGKSLTEPSSLTSHKAFTDTVTLTPRKLSTPHIVEGNRSVHNRRLLLNIIWRCFNWTLHVSRERSQTCYLLSHSRLYGVLPCTGLRFTVMSVVESYRGSRAMVRRFKKCSCQIGFWNSNVAFCLTAVY